MLTHDVDTLFAILLSPNADEDARKRALGVFMGQVAETPDANERLEAGRKLAEVFDWPDLELAFYPAVMCGALVEGGFPTQPFADAIARHLPDWASDTARFHTRALEQLGGAPEADDEGYQARIGEVFDELAEQHPHEFEAWQRLQNFYLPVVSVLSRDSATRQRLAPLAETLAPLGEMHEGADWLSKLLAVSERAPLLVIEPASKRGFVGLMSGVADNFQLHALLLGAFAQIDGETRISASALARAQGEDDAESDEIISSPWNLYNWSALGAGGALPGDMSGMAHWIWNEGTPGDISRFEDFRVVLLGPATYERQWPSGRLFSALPASIEVEHVLTLGEVAAWLGRLVEAPR